MTKTNKIISIKGLSRLSIILFLCLSLKSCKIQAQQHPSKFKRIEDSLVMINHHLTRFHPYGGLNLSSDAELYYLGPSLQAGADYNLNRQLSLCAYLQYFYASVNNAAGNNVSAEKGRYRTFTSAVLFQVNAGTGWYKGFFIGIGLALQQYADTFEGGLGRYDDSGTRLIPAIRTGYIFPAGLHAIALEFNGTGPYSYNDGFTGTVTEVFTQVSLGGRFIF